MKQYVERVMKNSAAMLEQLNSDLAHEQEDVQATEVSADNLAAVMEDYITELKITKRQRIRELMKRPEDEALIEETYDEMEAELQNKITGIRNQIDMLADKRNTILRVNRVAKLAIDVFQDTLDRDTLERNDLELTIRKIRVFEDRLEVELRPEIDQLIRCEVMETAVNFEQGSMDILKTELVQSSIHRKDKVYTVNVISDGDPLEIYTEKDGGVIFRKYSPMGDLQEFASQMCEAIGGSTGHIAAVADRDTIIALSGAPKRDLVDKPNSPELDRLMEQRRHYRYQSGESMIRASEGTDKYHLGVAAPILSQGDLMGCVMLLLQDQDKPLSESDQLLAQTAAGFLGGSLHGCFGLIVAVFSFLCHGDSPEN